MWLQFHLDLPIVWNSGSKIISQQQRGAQIIFPPGIQENTGGRKRATNGKATKMDYHGLSESNLGLILKFTESMKRLPLNYLYKEQIPLKYK